MTNNPLLRPSSYSVNFVNLDPMEDYMDDRIVLIEGFKEVQIIPESFQTTNLAPSLTKIENDELVCQLQKNVDLFVWSPSNMLRIDANVIFHCLTLNTTSKPIIQKKQEIQEEIRLATYKEEKKLKEAHL